MTLFLEVKADTNDADYVTQRTEITDDELRRFMPLIKAIKNTRGHNWATSEYARDDRPLVMYGQEFGEALIDEFQDYVPYGEYGVHTIVEVTLLQITKVTSFISRG